MTDTERDDIQIEEEDSGDTSAKLRKKLKTCVEEKQEYLDGWQRAKAELVNAKKDFAERESRTKELAEVRVVDGFLPVLDSFDMAFRGEAWENVDETWRKGIEYIHAQFSKSLEEAGVEAFDPLGEPFNPTIHEPVDTRPVDTEGEDHKVLEVLQKGYKKGETIIRPAKVIVGAFNN